MKKILFIFTVFVCLGLFWNSSVLAQEKLNNTIIRLDEMSSGKSTGDILVVFKTNSSVTENGIRLLVDNAWNISNTNSSYIVKTTGLPTGVLAVPNIGTTVTISDHGINLSCDDLQPNQSYGFFITGGFGINPSVGNNYLWELSTITSNGVDSSSQINIPIISSDQITITGKVPAYASDFQLDLSSNQVADLKVGDEITYTINYGSYLSTFTKPLKISAQWSRGTVIGSMVPSVDILDYVVGSGVNTDGGVSPVVDMVNRKITWTIPSFTANTINKTVSFKLKINDSYTGSSVVNFSVDAYLEAANVITISSTSNSFLKPVINVTPTSSLVINSSTSAETETPTPTQFTINTPMKIESVNVVGLSNTGFKINVKTNKNFKQIKIKYGLSINNLNKSITSINALKNDYLTINDLDPGTDYFFKIEAVDSNNEIIYSDIFTIRTTVIIDTLKIDKKSLIVSVSDSVLLDANNEVDDSNSVVITSNQNYAFRINVSDSNFVKSIKVLVVNSQVLGINTIYGAEPNSAGADFLKISNNGFIAHLVSPETEGFYNIVIHTEDTHGNINEEKVGTIRVVDPLIVLDEKGHPVENAKVIFNIFNSKLNIYELIPSSSSGVQNPNYTDENGKINVVLPKGKYQIEVSETGFVTQKINFTLGLGIDEKMPKVILINTSINFFDLVKYYRSVVVDSFSFSKQYLVNLTVSNRFFKLSSILVIMTSLTIVWFGLIHLFKVSWWMLPIKIISFFKKNNHKKINGLVLDKDTDLPIGNALVYLIDSSKNKILYKCFTDKLGNFSISIKAAESYSLVVIKKGYDPSPMMGYSKEGLMAKNLEIKIDKINANFEIIENNIGQILKKVVNILASIWLLSLLMLEFIFWHNFDWSRTWLLVVASCFNIIIWLVLTLKTNDQE